MIVDHTSIFCDICQCDHRADIIARNNRIKAVVYCLKGEKAYDVSSNAEMFLKFRNKSFTDISNKPDKKLRYILNYIPITDACNLNCTICGANAKNKTEEAVFLSEDEIYHRAEQAQRTGYKYVNLTGGEPTLHPHLLKIIKHIHGMGMCIGLNTNGLVMGKNQSLAEELKKCGLSRVVIQFDSLNENVLNRMNRNYLAEKKIAIQFALQAGLKVGLNCLVTRYNLSELDSLLSHGLEFKSGVINITFASPAPMGRYSLSNSETVDREEMVAQLLKSGSTFDFSIEDFSPLPMCLPWGIQMHPDCGIHVLFIKTPAGIGSLNKIININKLYHSFSRIPGKTNFLYKYLLPIVCLVKSIRRTRLLINIKTILSLCFKRKNYSLVNVGVTSYKSAGFLDKQRVARCAAAFYTSAGPVSGCEYAFRDHNFPGSRKYEEMHGIL